MTHDESELAATQRVARIGSWSWDADTGETRTSVQLLRLFGRAVIPPFACWGGALFSAEAWNQLNAAVQDSIRSGIGFDLDLPGLRGDGAPLWTNVCGEAGRGDAGAGVKLRGTIQDITARQQIDDEQRRLGQRLRDQHFYTRSLIESHVDALMITDPSGVITDVNRQTETLTNRTRDELIGTPCKSYFTDAARVDAGIKRVLRDGKITNYELIARSRDDKMTVVSFNATTFHDRDRRLQGVGASARDITERKRHEETLRQATQRANERAALAIHSGGIGIWDWNILTGAMDWDAQMCRLHGMAPREDLGSLELWTSVLHPDDRAGAELAVTEALGCGRPFDVEFRVLWPDRSVHYIHGTGVVTRDAEGRALRMLGANWDITERKRSEERIGVQKALLATTGRMAGVGGWELDPAAERLYWSDLVYEIHELPVGEPPALVAALDFYPADAKEHITDAVAASLARGTAFDLVVPFVTAKGNGRWVRVMGGTADGRRYVRPPGRRVSGRHGLARRGGRGRRGRLTRAMYAGVPTGGPDPCSNLRAAISPENSMYFGGGLLGTILIIALIVYLVRRS